MTAEFESIAELLLVILTITCILQAILVGFLLWYVKRVGDSLDSVKAAAHPTPQTPVAEAASASKAVVVEEVKGEAPPAPAPPAPAVDILGESPDIQGSIQRLCEKYSLSDFIITTMDGLVVVSLSPGSAEEAARFSDLFRRKKKPDSPGVTFLEIVHRGEPMLAILRSDHALTPGQTRGIDEDARKILNWWL
jgi:hypothetical protein